MQKRAKGARRAVGLAGGILLGLAVLFPAPRLIGSELDADSSREGSCIIQQDGAGQVGDAAPHLAAGTPEER